MASVNTGSKSCPKEALIMAAILKDMGVNEYEPRVVNQMMEFSYRKHVFDRRTTSHFVPTSTRLTNSPQVGRRL